jgi:hypothetical protein
MQQQHPCPLSASDSIKALLILLRTNHHQGQPQDNFFPRPLECEATKAHCTKAKQNKEPSAGNAFNAKASPLGKHFKELSVCDGFAAGTTQHSHWQSVKHMVVYKLHARPLAYMASKGPLTERELLLQVDAPRACMQAACSATSSAQSGGCARTLLHATYTDHHSRLGIL